ncbi:MlaD family protein [Patulibacter sp.]|uniref:MlaD family protein n=1 Tax=Patulibacter sp. TaxID=1912859 RepID=UPI00271A535D|nr:MlaD family protein [Patulibacter sp.]MDO9410383.1 MlaD family protein [Patulibacter sp.]
MPVRRHLLAGATAVVLVPVLAGCGGGGDAGAQGATGDTRLDAIFDNASFVGAGQDVRVAGATVGKVTKVELTKDRKARISMDVEPAFLPFRKDATCTILPQSLIGEKFVECDPGKPSAPALEGTDDDPATISIQQTQSPVDLDLVVAMLGQPTNVRTQLLLNEFGAGFATRGKDLDAAIRRSNPFLANARKTLTVLEGDKAALGRIVEASDTILSELDRRKNDITGTFDGAAEALKPTSQYRVQLDQAIAKLPATLSELKPALRSLRDLADDAKPTLASLRQSSPALSTLAGDLKPLSDAARPALRRLASASRTGTPILRRALPDLKQLQGTIAALAPVSPVARNINTSLSDNGAIENLARFIYVVPLATARKDAISHIVPANVVLTPCLLFTETAQPGCEAKFTSEASGANQLRSSQMKSFLEQQKQRAAEQPKTESTSRTLLPLAPTAKEEGR